MSYYDFNPSFVSCASKSHSHYPEMPFSVGTFFAVCLVRKEIKTMAKTKRAKKEKGGEGKC